jgi:hypothetical protein
MKQLWTWNWTSGGYNSCRADSRQEALSIGQKMGMPKAAMTVTLVVDESTLKPVSSEEMAKIDRWWGAMLN